MDGYLVAVGTIGGIYALLALGLNLQYGYTGLINFGVVGALSRSAPTPRRCWRCTACPSSLDLASRRAAGGGLRLAARADLPAAARRLPGHRHPRLRRDRPHRHRQRGLADQRDRAASPASRARSPGCRRRRRSRLSAPGAARGRGGSSHHDTAGAQPVRPHDPGHPRRRGCRARARQEPGRVQARGVHARRRA